MPYGHEKRNGARGGGQDDSTVSIPRITPEMIEQARREAPAPDASPTATGTWDADRLAAQQLAQTSARRRRTPAGPANLARPAPTAPQGDTTATFAMPEAYRMPAVRAPRPTVEPAAGEPTPEQPAAPRPAPAPKTDETAAPAPAAHTWNWSRFSTSARPAPEANAELTGTTLQMPEQPAAEKAAPKPAGRRRTRAQAEAELSQSIHDDHLWLNNPVLVRGLGLAPAVVAATTAYSALQLCAAAVLLLTATRVLAVALCHLTGGRQRPLLYALCAAVVYIPAYCILYRAFGADLTLLGIYLPLLVADPAIIKRMEAPELETVPEAFKRGVNNTLGFCLALLLLGILRELFGAGTVFGYTVLRRAVLPLAAQPAGGFLLVGLVAAVWTAVGGAYVHYKQEEVRHLYAERQQ